MSNESKMAEGELAERIAESLAVDLLAPETSMEVVRAVIEAAGLEASRVQRDGVNLVEELLRSPVAGTADRGGRGPRIRGGLPSRLRRMSREQLVAQVNAFRSNAATARPTEVRLGVREPTDVDEAELRAILEEIQGLFDADESDEE